MAMVQRNLPSAEADRSTMKTLFPQMAPHDKRWVAIELRLSGRCVLFVAAYFLTAELLSHPVNAECLRQIGLYKDFLKAPLILAADWQNTPAQAAECAAFLRLGLQIVLPKGGDFSCRTGRFIDYFAVSPELEGLVSSDLCFRAPCATHLGVQLRLRCDFDEVKFWKLWRPAALPISTAEFDQVAWSQAGVVAKTRLADRKLSCPGICGKPPVGDFPVTVAPRGLRKQQVDFSRNFAEICFRIELYYLIVAAVPKARWKMFLGRCQFPRYTLAPALPKHPLESKFACLACSLWVSVRQSLATLRTALGKLAPCSPFAMPAGPRHALGKLSHWRDFWVEPPSTVEEPYDPDSLAPDHKLDLSLAFRALLVDTLPLAASALDGAIVAVDAQKRQGLCKESPLPPVQFQSMVA